MLTSNRHFFWVGDPADDSQTNDKFTQLENIAELPSALGGLVCISHENTDEIDASLRAFYSRPESWSWCVFVTNATPLSECVTDGIYDYQLASSTWDGMRSRLETMKHRSTVDPLIGWLGVNRERRVKPLKSITSTSIYSYPIIDLFFPDLNSTYRYVLAEQKQGVLEQDQLIDRIRVCSKCNSGHLNYIEVCPSCSSIDIESQSSLHCFTCGHVGEQQSFLRRGKLECPKCLTQLRHIGVDYDRPLENHVCNSCNHLFVEASTVSHCLSCSSQIAIEDLVVRKIYKMSLGETGEYTFQHGKIAQAPTLSIKGKVDVSYFQNLLVWVNKVALRHGEKHLLLGLHLPSLDDYGKQYGDARLFALMDQLTTRLGSLFRDTDICCQFRQDVLLVLMPNTKESSLAVLRSKLKELSGLIDEDDFVLNAFAWTLPNKELDADIDIWLESITGEIYAAR